MMHNEVSLVGTGAHARGETTARGIFNNEANDVGFLRIANLLYVLEGILPVNHPVQMVKVMGTGLVVVDTLRVDQPESNVPDTTVAKGLVGLLDCQFQHVPRVA